MSKAAKLRELMSTPAGIARVQAEAKRRYPDFPKSGCGANLSTAVRLAGYDIEFNTWAQDVIDEMRREGWTVVSKRDGRAGDVGVSIDLNGNGATDHVFYVVSRDGDRMLVADNQAKAPHPRTISGKDGKTATDFFLRPPAEDAETFGRVVVDGRPVKPNEQVWMQGRSYVWTKLVGGVWDPDTKTVTIETGE